MGILDMSTIQLAPIQQQIVAQLQHDEGYLAHLQREIEVVKERVAANRGKLDLLAELAQQTQEDKAEAAECNPG